MLRPRLFVVLGVLGGAALAAGQTASGPIFGFTTRSAAAERALERTFLTLPSADTAREDHKLLTAEPHVAGSPRDRVLAEWVRDRWRAYGLDRVEIVEHQVLLPYPTEIVVELPNASPPWRAATREDPIDGDAATANDPVPAYHAYSASGDITAPVVYAADGNAAEYDWLEAHGIAVRHQIVLVHYSLPYSYRGAKVLEAERRGAAGILIYSDPADDGSGKGKTYPEGPWGPPARIQRGAVGYTFKAPGDPLTPGWPSMPGGRRLAARDAEVLPAILSAPLSEKDARAILQTLHGPEAPREWQGGLPLAYHVGGDTLLHMRVRMDDAVRPIWSVTGQITGAASPDDLVIVGNHRDAWTYGGVDPSSGTTSMMELARSLGALARRGSRPKRTILFASWDAEEFALTGSTEWGEQHEDELSAHAVAYLNVDSAASGTTFTASAVPALNRLIGEAADAVVDPETGRSIAAAVRGSGADLVNNRIGTGSDYAVFLNFIGAPIADLSFTGPYGVYHSLYDDHEWVERFGDPGFRYQTTMARLWGLMALRLANADVLPLDYRASGERIKTFVEEARSSQPAQNRSSMLQLRAAADRLAAAAVTMNERIAAALGSGQASAATLNGINQALMATERAFISKPGLPGRPWYRHLIYAPLPTYAAEVLPGVTEAIASGDRSRLADETDRLTVALDRAAQILQGSPIIRP